VLRKAAKFGEEGEVDKAREVISTSFLFDIDRQEYIISNFAKDWISRQKQRKVRKNDDNRKQIRFNIGPLDDICQIFTDQSSLVGIAATSGVGKSIFGVNIGTSAFLEGVRVAHFVFENVIEQVVGRYDSRIIGKPYREIMRYKWKKKEILKARALMKDLRKKFGTNLKIFHFPIRTCSIHKTEAVLKEVEIAEGWRPDVIIYDSLDHMIPGEKQESYRLNVTRVWEEAKWQSEVRNIPVISTTHAKASERHQLVRMEGFSESYDKPRLSDVWITISQTIEQEDDRQAVVFLDKNRDDEGKVKLLVDLMFNVMTIRFVELME
jgi:replicative DNA helicase